MQESGLIVSNPNVMMGKPVIRGTRITVELLLEKFAAGQSEEQILLAHPHISREGIRAALAFAALYGVLGTRNLISKALAGVLISEQADYLAKLKQSKDF